MLQGGLDEVEANRIAVLLASMGIEAVLDADSYGGLGIYVPLSQSDAAKRLVREEQPERQSSNELRTTTGINDDNLAAPKAWFGRGSFLILALAVACVTVFALAMQGDDAGSRSRLLEFGAIDATRVNRGEHWRLFSAIFLHFDAAHLLANLSMLLIVGPPLAHQIGPRRFLMVFVASGVGANVVSHLFAPVVGLKAGASGAIAGVLGGLGGLALRPGTRTRRKNWQTLGALAAMYGFLIGFGPGRDNVAHVAGLILGVAIALLIPSERRHF